MKKRRTIPKSVEKRAYQEARSTCSFCDEAEVTALQVHHIDGNPSNNALDNLFVACASCHAKVTSGVIAESAVRERKRQLASAVPAGGSALRHPAVQVTIEGSSFRGDIAQNLTKIVTAKSPRITHPVGSLGADLRKKGYVDYLITQYFTFRKADRSFGLRRPFNHAEIHQSIQRRFGYKTFFMPTELFDELVQFLYQRIDQTVLGKTNRAKGKANYHGFEQHGLDGTSAS